MAPEPNDPPQNRNYYEELRIAGWRHIAPFARGSLPFPDPSWYRSDVVLAEDPKPWTTGRLKARLAPPRELSSKDFVPHPIFEMTFFNETAKRFILKNRLNRRDETRRLQRALVREIELPPRSKAIKTFWYILPRGEKIDVPLWDWSATAKTNPAEPHLDRSVLSQVCVSEDGGNGCLKADRSFVTMKVDDPKAYLCIGAGCKSLQHGDQLLMVALHVASKDLPDWLWATFWWRGEKAPSNSDAWTCPDSQREEAIGNIGPPWDNYSLDVIASFKYTKPKLPVDHPCGAPTEIGMDQERLASYSPFVEAWTLNGFKSSCVDCHSRASTNGTPDDGVPTVNYTGGPRLRDFEGHIRLDYLWSLRRTMENTPLPADTN